jgi:hypothetical protein
MSVDQAILTDAARTLAQRGAELRAASGVAAGLARLGGEALLARRGREHYREMGRKSGERRRELAAERQQEQG